MVKSTFIAASIAIMACVVSAQDTPTAVSSSGSPTAIPTNLSIPSGAIPSGAIPTDIGAAVSSIMKNPGGMQSYISMASEKVGSLPSQYQSSAYSALSEASKTLASIQPKRTGSPTATPRSNDSNMFKPSGYLASFVVSVAVVFGVIQ